ncbi:MAG: hypothetical protein U0531_04330 [Dehalococcoidia bacterium]
MAGDAGQDQCFRAAITADEASLSPAALARSLQFQGQVRREHEPWPPAPAIWRRGPPREQGHVAAIATAVAGDQASALDLVHEHVAEFPRDAFVLSRTTASTA